MNTRDVEIFVGHVWGWVEYVALEVGAVLAMIAGACVVLAAVLAVDWWTGHLPDGVTWTVCKNMAPADAWALCLPGETASETAVRLWGEYVEPNLKKPD